MPLFLSPIYVMPLRCSINVTLLRLQTSKFKIMELQLGLSLPLHNLNLPTHSPKSDSFDPKNCIERKRGFTRELPKTLPLLSWNDKPKDDPDQPPPNAFSTIQNKDEEKNQAVGWPPIESWRKKALHLRSQPPQMAENRRTVAADDRSQSGGLDSFFVKVKMEGVAIARKLDLRLYASHNSLKTALIAMFTTCEAIDNKGWDFTLIYEDKDGDWLLAEDLPWNSFVESVQRLKILVRKRNKE